MIRTKNHPYHLVTSTWLPLFISFLLFSLIFIGLYTVNQEILFYTYFWFLCFSFFLFIFSWFVLVFFDSVSSSIFTTAVQQAILQGFILFIVSEVMLFASVFWAIFHNSLSPSIFIDSLWPPLDIIVLSPWGLPFVNTTLLLTSGVTLNWGYYKMHLANLYKNHKFGSYFFRACEIKLSFIVTVMLGFIFLQTQYIEYTEHIMFLYTTLFGTLFFSSTGLHGLHVIVGVIMLFVFTIFFWFGFYASKARSLVLLHSGVWYWHFVDVVWLFLFLTVYIWAGVSTPLILL